MAGIDDSLDSEFDDPITSIPIVSKKSIRKKVIGLDDLLADFYHERSKCVEKEAKRVKKAPKKLVSDELDTKEASLSMLVDQCQTQMIEMGGDEENSHWGVQLFGDQRSSPSMAAPTLEKCDLLKSFMNNEVNSLIELSFENGETFTEGLLVSGWLTKLVLARGHVDESIAKRVSHLMFYSSKEELRTTACNFWCEILSTAKESMKIDWLPSYSDIRKALDVYGFVSLPGTGVSSANSSCRGPGQNIISWIRFATICGQVRDSWPVFSTSDAEELIEVIISVFLDRHLQGLSVLLYKCMQTLINYLMDEEWVSSSKKIAKYLARSVPKDLNCIRIVECISGIDDRSKHLRSLVAYETLFALFDCKAVNDEILRLLLAINLKERSCDLFKAYIYLVLTENWLLSNKLIEEKPVLKEMWGLYLRQCNCMISSTDLRSFAPKIRDRASFLQQGAKRIQQGF